MSFPVLHNIHKIKSFFIILLNKAVITQKNVSLHRLKKQKNCRTDEIEIFSTVSFFEGVCCPMHFVMIFVAFFWTLLRLIEPFFGQ